MNDILHKKSFEILKTTRLILRKLTTEVYQYVFDNYSDLEAMNFFGLKSETESEKEKAKFQKGLSTYNRSFLIFQLLEIQNEKVIGWCGYHSWYLDHNRAEIGYAITDETFKGMGFMAEAMERIIEYGFNEMDLNRIEAFIGPDNIPSLKLVQKFGFTKEGHLREHYVKNNKAEDSIVFSLLKSEYKTLMD